MSEYKIITKRYYVKDKPKQKLGFIMFMVFMIFWNIITFLVTSELSNQLYYNYHGVYQEATIHLYYSIALWFGLSFAYGINFFALVGYILYSYQYVKGEPISYYHEKVKENE